MEVVNAGDETSLQSAAELRTDLTDAGNIFEDLVLQEASAINKAEKEGAGKSKDTQAKDQAAKVCFLKRIARNQKDISVKDLESNIAEIGANLQKRKPEYSSSSNSENSPTFDSPRKIAWNGEFKTKSKLNEFQKVSPILLKTKHKANMRFPCFFDDQIYNANPDIGFQSKLKKHHGADNDADTSSEELLKNQKNSFLHLQDAVRRYKKKNRHKLFKETCEPAKRTPSHSKEPKVPELPTLNTAKSLSAESTPLVPLVHAEGKRSKSLRRG